MHRLCLRDHYTGLYQMTESYQIPAPGLKCQLNCPAEMQNIFSASLLPSLNVSSCLSDNIHFGNEIDKPRQTSKVAHIQLHCNFNELSYLSELGWEGGGVASSIIEKGAELKPCHFLH